MLRVLVWFVKFLIFGICCAYSIIHLTPKTLGLNSIIPEAARTPQIVFSSASALCRFENRPTVSNDDNFVDNTDPNENPSRQTFLFALPVSLDNSFVNFSRRMVSARKCYMDTKNPIYAIDACFCLGNFIPPAVLIVSSLALAIQYGVALVIICKISTNAHVWLLGVRLLIGLAVYNGILFLAMGCLHMFYISPNWPFTYTFFQRIPRTKYFEPPKEDLFYYAPFSWTLAAVLAYAAACLTAIEALLWSKINTGIELFP